MGASQKQALRVTFDPGLKLEFQGHPLCQGKAENEPAKRLAKLWRRVNIKKKARAVRGRKIKREIPE